MESEFLKDLKDLSAAFEIHIKEDEDQWDHCCYVWSWRFKVSTLCEYDNTA